MEKLSRLAGQKEVSSGPLKAMRPDLKPLLFVALSESSHSYYPRFLVQALFMLQREPKANPLPKSDRRLRVRCAFHPTLGPVPCAAEPPASWKLEVGGWKRFRRGQRAVKFGDGWGDCLGVDVAGVGECFGNLGGEV